MAPTILVEGGLTVISSEAELAWTGFETCVARGAAVEGTRRVIAVSSDFLGGVLGGAINSDSDNIGGKFMDGWNRHNWTGTTMAFIIPESVWGNSFIEAFAPATIDEGLKIGSPQEVMTNMATVWFTNNLSSKVIDNALTELNNVNKEMSKAFEGATLEQYMDQYMKQVTLIFTKYSSDAAGVTTKNVANEKIVDIIEFIKDDTK